MSKSAKPAAGTKATKPAKLGPGEYRADPTEGIQRVEDLPKPKIVKQNRNYAHRPCPRCGRSAYRDQVYVRALHDVGDLVSGRPRELQVTYSQHFCTACQRYFPADLSDLAPPRGQYTHRVMSLAVRVVVEDGLPYRAASWHAECAWRDHRVFVPFATIQNWVEAGGKRDAERFETEYLNWALADFSGYLAADELYDGPFCVLSIVDNRTFKRLFYQVLDHDACQADVAAFFRAFRAHLDTRGLSVHAITTDGSKLYPGAIAEVFGGIPHQICQFHILADLSKAVLHAVASVRKSLAARQPKPQRGRPTQQSRALVRQRQRLQAKIADLFTHRYLFVQRHLTPSERQTVQRITRGLPHLRALRDIMDEVYRLFDRRCRTATALVKLARLRQRVQRFTKVGKTLQPLFSANIDKALTFLDDRLLPATSNAVERGNRRHRKMQKTVYHVRTAAHIHNRLALDLFREARASPRSQTLQALHRARAAPRPAIPR